MKPASGHWTIQPVAEEDHDLVRGLLQAASWQHRHLDWAEAEDLLNQQPFLLASDQGLPVACLACPPDPMQAAWIRVFAVASGYDLATCWALLWQQAQSRLEALGVSSCAALAIPDWLPDLLLESGFEQADAVIFLEWDAGAEPPTGAQDLELAPLLETDLTEVAALDRRAFEPLWQLSLESLDMALAQSAYATIYRTGDELAGYQISTASDLGGHLARLAVDPPRQGRGIASAMVSDVLCHFRELGLPRVTVNTQGANERGQSLYERLGFARTGQAIPVYRLDLEK